MWREPHIDTAAWAAQGDVTAPLDAPSAASGSAAAPGGAAASAAASAAAPAAAPAAAGRPGADWIYCPECGMPAWVEWADAAPTTAGPAQHVKIRCFSRHWFLMLREHLEG